MKKSHDVQFTLSYKGRSAESHEIDLYDVSQALIGFQRSLALTTHLILKNEIITQSPALKGASIYALPAEEGSWKLTAGIVITGLSTGIYTLGTAPKDTPIGHLIHSAYDYVISESLGVHVDYEKSLGQLYEEAQKKKQKIPEIKEHQLDSLIEKCSTAITEIHRPIYKTGTADSATIVASLYNQTLPVGTTFSRDTYEYIRETFMGEEPEIIKGRISSYNSNTFKGRIYVAEEGRPVSFELSENIRTDQTVKLIVLSLSVNALKDYDSEWSDVYCRVFKNKSKLGHLKNYKIIEVSNHALSPGF